MPEQELLLLIETLAKQIQSVQDSQDKLRQFVVEQLREMAQHYTRREQFQAVQEDMDEYKQDMDELKDKLEEVRQSIINDQTDKFKQTIALQASILMLIIGGIVSSFFIPQIAHLFGH